ncbi:hypothetical protein BGZ65_003577 [Modicella reniformis]|uniref:Coiled-coil SMC6 And NSE5 INteracting (CANIN) domain-containing protein n=1 Tax=Modicella reniformis TaxID=1440133 RepID=A0A9P6M233_9FUNG|nr:hypothetical protein BGZ65_003577 [Modicella reniformis]
MGRLPKNQNASHLTKHHHTQDDITCEEGANKEYASSKRGFKWKVSNNNGPLKQPGTRLIESYFQPNFNSTAVRSPSLLGPTASQEPEQTTATGEDTTKSESVASSETVKSNTADSSIVEPLYDPFNSQDYGDWEEDNVSYHSFDDESNNPFISPKKTETVDEAKSSDRRIDRLSPELGPVDALDPASLSPNPFISPKQTETVTESDQTESADPNRVSPVLGPIDSLGSIDSLGPISFSPKLSGESLRRLALSPRKQKKTRDFSPALTPSKPTMTFAERLAAEIEDSSVPDDQLLKKILASGGRDCDPAYNNIAIVMGSDPESDAEWNDKDIFMPPVKETTKEDESAVRQLDSDEDIPTLNRFCGGRAPIDPEESDSDLDDNPFMNHSAGVSSLPPMMVLSADQLKIEELIDGELSPCESSESDELDKHQDGEKAPRIATPLGSNDRVLRRSTRNPVPVITPKQILQPTRVTKRPTLFSLDTLLKEKKRKAEVGFDLRTASSQLKLDEELLNEFDAEDEDEVLFGPDSIPKGVLSEEQEGALAEIIEEEQNFIVEDYAEFFVCWPQDVVVQPLDAWLSGADLSDHVVQKVLKYTQTELQRQQFLTSPFLMIMSSSPWTMPRSLFRWLVHIVAAEQNQLVTSSVFALLQRILSQKTSFLGVDHQDLVQVFRMYGVKDECLEQQWKVAPVTPETRRERTILPETKKFPRLNLKAVIKLINMSATLDPQFYNIAEIRKIMNLLLRMTTDPIISDIKSQIGSTMVALLDAIPADEWETERYRLCEEIKQTLGTSLPFMLLALRQLPSLSVRITLLRRSIALSYLEQPPIPAGMMAPNLEELHRALFVDRGFWINSETNYSDLGRRVQVLGLCLDDEQMIAAYGRKALEPLMRKLRMMHGKIVDIRAAFMDRTIAKDVIQRLYMRMYYAGIHRQSTTQSTLNFAFAATSKLRAPVASLADENRVLAQARKLEFDG